MHDGRGRSLHQCLKVTKVLLIPHSAFRTPHSLIARDREEVIAASKGASIPESTSQKCQLPLPIEREYGVANPSSFTNRAL